MRCFNPLTSGAGTATLEEFVPIDETNQIKFQSPDERGGYCDNCRVAGVTALVACFNPLTSGAGTATLYVFVELGNRCIKVSIP